MFGVFKNKYSFLYLISIPALLLILAVAYDNSKEVSFVKEVNPYLKTLPTEYEELFDKYFYNDSSFFGGVIDKGYARELIIGRAFPNKTISGTDFLIDLEPADKKFLKSNKSVLSLNLENDAAIYNYNGKTFGLFKQPLPLIDIEKIKIKQKAIYAKQKVWNTALSPAFEPISETQSETQQFTTGIKQSPSPYAELYEAVLNDFGIASLPHDLIIDNENLFQLNANPKGFITENDLTLAIIDNENQLWKMLNTRDNSLKQIIDFQGNNSAESSALLENFIKDDLEFEALFDLNKLGRYKALRHLFSKGCNDKIAIAYNKDNGLFEPFSMGSQCLGELLNYVPKTQINNTAFIKAYALALQEAAEIDITDLLNDERESLRPYVELINHYNPMAIFNPDLIRINQRVIRKSLNPSALVKAEIVDVNPSGMVVSLQNMSNYPIEIRELNHKTKKMIAGLNPWPEIRNGSKDTVTIDLPRSFENLFVSKKKKITGFKLYKHFPEIFIGYSISGLEGVQYAPIIPYQAKEGVKDDLFRREVSIKDRKGITIDERAKTISFSEKQVTLAEALIIPRGYTFKIDAGTTIDIVNGGKIISYAPLSFTGTQRERIQFMSSDSKGQGMLVLADGMESQLTFVKFDNLSNPKHGNWSVTGALSFYESPAKFNNVVIENNRCEDALNMIRTNFHMRFCRISNTQSDAFDGDFVKGNIIDCSFNDLGNDAIDVSGSELIIKRVVVKNAGDKGLSAGEDSKMEIANVKILDSEIGLAGKDFSIVNAKDLEISNTKLAFTAFQKKPEFGPSHIKVDGITMTNIETKYLIENTSSLIVDGEKIKTSQNVKDRMYGVEFGRSSAETNTNQ